MKKDRRWLKSVIASSQDLQVALPWHRSSRRKPEAVKAVSGKPQAVAAR